MTWPGRLSIAWSTRGTGLLADENWLTANAWPGMVAR
jgi:hypothetical protein